TKCACDDPNILPFGLPFFLGTKTFSPFLSAERTHLLTACLEIPNVAATETILLPAFTATTARLRKSNKLTELKDRASRTCIPRTIQEQVYKCYLFSAPINNITKRFSIREIARKLKMNVSLAHRNMLPLIEEKYLLKDDKGYLFLNFRKNHEVLSYCEYLRRNEFLQRHKVIALLNDDTQKKLPYGCFVLLVFGSTVNSSKPRDLDLLLIIEKTDEIEQAERYFYNIYNNFTLKVHPVIVSFESVDEMLESREQMNVLNEVLNKHIVLYGAELFYKLISRGRK
ncbi:MAG: hypothetical protein ABIJ21_05635, partial [Nanoarchaeota archaeon]